ncbi:50S ribosomal protein L25 [Candidatus Parcubacteria bacterium]|nr:50S ribosomal protein L25 [Candidatus Parcubacteria bacterium]
MFTLSAAIRNEKEKVKTLREKGFLPAVLYGPKIKNFSLQLNEKEFEKLFKQAGESSLISLEIKDKKEKFLVLVHDFQKDPLKGNFIHVDFYQPALDEETEATVPLEFIGEAPAVKELSGTLVKNISEVEVKALPQNLPHEIKVDISCLKTFDDSVLIKDLIIAKEVKIIKEPEEIVALVTPPEKVEEELEKPIEEKPEEVEKVEKEEKEETEEEKTEKKEKE